MINFIPGIQSTGAALNAERIRMEVIAQNIANATTTRTTDGRPYQRQMVVFENVLDQAQMAQQSGGVPLVGPTVTNIRKDLRPGQNVSMPGHPHADAQGMVTMPNVNIYTEMADQIVAARAFEANLAVIKHGRYLAMQELSIGKR